ncbi:MAG: hypothetical protein U1G07_22010 [Verrucomicrobiota bacterium]
MPIDEQAVPPSDLQGESAWPTQPLPSKPAPFARQLFSASELNDLSPDGYRAFLAQFIKVRPHTAVSPPTTEGTIITAWIRWRREWAGQVIETRDSCM